MIIHIKNLNKMAFVLSIKNQFCLWTSLFTLCIKLHKLTKKHVFGGLKNEIIKQKQKQKL